MFGRAQSFDTDITSWNTGNVENMQAMFYFALRFNQPIGVWDVSSVVSTQNDFHEKQILQLTQKNHLFFIGKLLWHVYRSRILQSRPIILGYVFCY